MTAFLVLFHTCLLGDTCVLLLAARAVEVTLLWAFLKTRIDLRTLFLVLGACSWAHTLCRACLEACCLVFRCAFLLLAHLFIGALFLACRLHSILCFVCFLL